MAVADPDGVFAALAGALESGALLVDHDGLVVEANVAFERLAGAAPGTLAGTRPPYPWLGASEAAREIGRALAEHRPVTVWAPLGDASPVEVEIDVRPLGGTAGAVLLVRSLRRFRLDLEFIARHAGDVISVHDADGRFAFVSDACQRLYGRRAEDLVGHSPFEIVVGDDRPRIREALAAFRSGTVMEETLHFRALRPDGTEVAVDCSARAVRDEEGRLTSVMCIARDATSRIVAERAAARDAARRSQVRAAEQAALRRVAIAAATETDPASVLGTVAREVATLLGAEHVAVLSLDGPGFDVTGVHGAAPGLDVGTWIPGGATAKLAEIARWAGRQVEEPGPGALPPPLRDGAMVAAPVEVDGHPWGAVVAVATPGTPLAPSAERRLARFCEVVGVAVGAADARRRLAAQAITDPLTGLANHRAFQERLRSEVARALRYGRALSLIVLDLDHFKNLNDWYGHQEGDRALVEVAARLQQAARQGDLVARVGGEEFAWILPETDGLQAQEAGRRARELVGGTPLQGGQRLTVSAGVCDLGWARSADELYRLADGALYWAKANGRDQVCLYAPELVEPLSAEQRADWLARSQQVTALRALVRALDARLPGAWPHAERVAALAGDIALAMGWSVEAAMQLREAALLHDVGLIAMSDELAARMRAGATGEACFTGHPVIGCEIARDALNPEQCEWIRHHHERVDGTGYPDRLAGERIPSGAAILAVADAFDQMTESPSRPFSAAESIEVLRAEAGSWLDPDVVEALAGLHPQVASGTAGPP